MRFLFFIFLLLGFTANSQMLIDSYRFSAPCVPDPNEQYTTPDAASDPNCNETNAVTRWNTNASATVSLESTDVNVGNYAVSVVSNAGSTEYMFISLFVANGQSVTLTYDMKQSVGSNGATFMANISGATNHDPTGSWASYTENLTGNGATAVFRWYPAGNDALGSINDEILVDNISIVFN